MRTLFTYNCVKIDFEKEKFSVLQMQHLIKGPMGARSSMGYAAKQVACLTYSWYVRSYG